MSEQLRTLADEDGHRRPDNRPYSPVRFANLRAPRSVTRWWKLSECVHLTAPDRRRTLCGIHPGSRTVVVAAEYPATCSRCVKYAKGRRSPPKPDEVADALREVFQEPQHR